MAKRVKKFKYTDYVVNAIKAAKLAIDSFNRVDLDFKDEAALIFMGQAWEFLAKALIIKNLGIDDIFLKNGKSITAEIAVNKINHEMKKIGQDEAEVIQQIISLRNVAMHDVMPKVPAEIIVHLLFYSIKAFRIVLEENFRTYFKKDFDQNFLAIAFNNHTFYSDKVSKMFNKAKDYGSDQSKTLYLLDRAVDFARKPNASSMQSLLDWQGKIKRLPRKSRVAMHLAVYKHMNEHDDVRFVPVEVARGFRAEINLTRTKDKKNAGTVLVKKTDPNKDYPHSTSDVALKAGRNKNFIARMSARLDIRNNQDLCYLIKTGKYTTLPKYSDAAVTYVIEYLKKNPNFDPYKV